MSPNTYRKVLKCGLFGPESKERVHWVDIKTLATGTVQARTSQKAHWPWGWKRALENFLAGLGIKPLVSGSWES